MQINTMMNCYNITYKWNLIYENIYKVGINIIEFNSMVLIYFHNYIIMNLI
jgi:hypothetical protein